MLSRRLAAFAAALLIPLAGRAADFPTPIDSESPDTAPMAPEEVVKLMNLPPGFQATVFAAEPDVRQPIAMCFDSRGRLWVAECYTYAERPLGYDLRMRDRIVIFEDTKGTGHFDKRTVFWDGAQRLTSIAVGLDGVYALCLPNLLFIPNHSGGDVPDGPPKVLLDGFDFGAAAHTMANGLKWGPDGWLYGRQGILAGNLSHVGPPGSPAAARTQIGCGIWRYHPTRHLLEQLTEGTTNPWGMDWNEYGDAFFINTVIGHLWQMIPGAHYRRMFGDDPSPHVYGLIEQFADHVHWNNNELWSDVRKLGVTDASSRAGGGHAHTGLLCYLGENWPASYRGELFTINFHGRRLNTERLERDGSGYVGRRGDDWCFVPDPWFRGTELLQGPDGGVFISDWSDTGECHDQNGVHRNSGRIYKLTYGHAEPLKIKDVAQLTPAEMAASLQGNNEWVARQIERVLQARFAAGEDVREAQHTIEPLLDAKNATPIRLRALWTLYSSGGMPAGTLSALLLDPDEHLRIWSIRLLLDDLFPPDGAKREETKPREDFYRKLSALAGQDPSPAVRLALASALQRLPLDGAYGRAALAAPLLAHAEDAGDHSLPLMLWYGIASLPGPVLAELAPAAKIPIVQRYCARRLAEEYDHAPTALEALLPDGRAVPFDGNEAPARAARAAFEALLGAASSASAGNFLEGLSEAFSGRRRVAAPAGWPAFRQRFAGEASLAPRILDLSALFGDGRALDEIRAIAEDPARDLAARRAAVQGLVENRAPGLRALCEKLLDVRDLASAACGGLALFDDPAIADLLIEKYPSFYGHEKAPALGVLTSRPAFALKLLDAVAAKQIPAKDLTAFHARQIRNFNNPELTRKLTETWGDLHDSNADKAKLIADWKARLTPEVLTAADKSKGRAVFSETCAVCHKLYGAGAAIGPDLTGGGRSSLDYLLENIGDPSAIVPTEYHLNIVAMKDGRVLAGIIAAKNERSITLQTLTDRVSLDRDEIRQTTESAQSLMPDGLLQSLTPEQTRDLIAYLMSPGQVPMPDAK